MLVYNADLFSEKRMAALLDQWLSLLDQIAADPAKPIDQFSLVTPSAQACLPDPSARLDETWLAPIHSLIACQAEKAPEKVAVIGADESWTYRELDGASNRLAGLLSRKKYSSGRRGRDLCAPRSDPRGGDSRGAEGRRRFCHSRSGVSGAAPDRLCAHRATERLAENGRRRRLAPATCGIFADE